MKKHVGKMLLGAIAGFIVAYGVMHLKFDVNMPAMGFEFTIIFMIITMILISFSLIGYMKVKGDAKKQLVGDAQDELETLQYKRSSDTMIASNTAIYFSTLMLAIVSLTDVPNIFIFISLGLVLVSIVLNTIYANLGKSLQPERNWPSVNDKDYAKKILAISDEGERHVILQGLYGAFASLNGLLLLAIFILIGYSAVSGVSQLLAIFIIVFILIITNTQYMLTIRNK
ncbi:DUF3169 family protein [Lysinibacillus piscis]|uniref:DUF3169 family protein n=1 Tax=Lysinibacillus piscis TaxID=2518931 RepID=A0ABQ5NPR6_9BACI|nr:DUF3169 family protein [Lysinibacillus sp. KH24]GLC90330.1 DUF3169 family protein [Lysinibacillus sp. KH24]